jgi:ElaB/YqjD/DUF883 family membrane-anchored ribosome-binding protein
MNEFVTDLEKPAKTADEWISSSADAVRAACHEANNEMSSVMKRGRDFYVTVCKRVGKEANAANAVMHSNPYPPVLVAIGAGALLGYLVACRLNGRSG